MSAQVGMSSGVGKEVALYVVEVVEVRRPRGSGRILAAHPDKRPGEVGAAGRGGLVREDAGVELLWEPVPAVTLEAVGEAEPLVVNLDAQLDGGVGRDGNRRGQGVGLGLVGQG